MIDPEAMTDRELIEWARQTLEGVTKAGHRFVMLPADMADRLIELGDRAERNGFASDKWEP